MHTISVRMLDVEREARERRAESASAKHKTDEVRESQRRAEQTLEALRREAVCAAAQAPPD